MNNLFAKFLIVVSFIFIYCLEHFCRFDITFLFPKQAICFKRCHESKWPLIWNALKNKRWFGCDRQNKTASYGYKKVLFNGMRCIFRTFLWPQMEIGVKIKTKWYFGFDNLYYIFRWQLWHIVYEYNLLNTQLYQKLTIY